MSLNKNAVRIITECSRHPSHHLANFNPKSKPPLTLRTCLRLSSASSQFTMSSATLLPTAIVSFAVSSDDEELHDTSDTTQGFEVPTTMRLNDRLTALISPTNPAPSGHLTSKGCRRPRDYHLVAFTTESLASQKAPTCCKHPVDVGGQQVPAHLRFPPSSHSDCWLMSCADISNPLGDRTTINAAFVRHVGELTTNKTSTST